MPTTPRFIVDAMLGDLARWLRMLGYDTKYNKNYEDWQLIKIAMDEDRILLTRDMSLFRRANTTFRKAGRDRLRAFYLEWGDIEDVLANLAILLRRKLSIDLRLDIDPLDTRCPICNSPLRYTTSLVEIAGRVPEVIANRYREFWICSGCGKVYWRGKHWITIEEKLKKAKEKISSSMISKEAKITKKFLLRSRRKHIRRETKA
ncbi:MAG: hypothetical protein DRO15_07930 [Thermoprotei archaeon]|nr:MAG: hypothetical protein DRO15_07930 [Thermoprotei archaeon]